MNTTIEIDRDKFACWVGEVSYMIGACEGKEIPGRISVPSLENISRKMTLYISTLTYHGYFITGRISHNDYPVASNEISHYKQEIETDDQALTLSRKLRDAVANVFRHISGSPLAICAKSFPNGCNGRPVSIPIGQEICLTCQRLTNQYGDDGVPDKSGYVYLIGNPKVGLVKIGCSNKPDTRISAARKDVPFDVWIIHTIKTNQKYVGENIFHSLMENKRLEREWFQMEPSHIRFLTNIESVNCSDGEISVKYKDDILKSDMDIFHDSTTRNLFFGE